MFFSRLVKSHAQQSIAKKKCKNYPEMFLL